MKRLRVLLIDDHPLYRQGITFALESMPDLQIVGEAGDGQTAIEAADALSPEVVIIDINLPGLNGLETARAIRRMHPNISVVVLTVHEDDEQLFNAIRVGAAAFITKDVGPERLAESIRRVGNGEYLIDECLMTHPALATRVLDQFRDLESVNLGSHYIFSSLTSREVEILDCIVRGMSNKEIANSLVISDQTVKNHITSILRKLAVNDRTQAVIYALRKGWVMVGNDPDAD